MEEYIAFMEMVSGFLFLVVLIQCLSFLYMMICFIQHVLSGFLKDDTNMCFCHWFFEMQYKYMPFLVKVNFSRSKNTVI